MCRRGDLTRLENRLLGEINIESIKTLDERIKQHERALVDLKRTRNSLLNVSKLPPEVLGNIFRWNVSLKNDFGGLEKGSHNFLSVCHHWHEVALGTPELWSFWGNTLKDWARWSRRSGTAPVDLVIDGTTFEDTIDYPLSNVLRDRAAWGTIRRIHLRSENSNLLRSIISQITPEEPRSTDMESFILRRDENISTTVDISDFLTYNRFPKLQRLEYCGCRVSSWDLLKSRSPVLTTLDIFFRGRGPSPNTSQLLSILASYPTLQNVALSWSEDPVGGGGAPSGRASLHHLKELDLFAPVEDLFGLLDRLDHPRNMDRLRLTPDRCPFEDISRTIGPYLQDYLRGRGMSQTGLGLSLQCSPSGTIRLFVGDMGAIDFLVPTGPRVNTFMTINVYLIRRPPRDLLGGAIADLIARTSREEVVYFQACGDIVAMNMKDIYTLLPNLRGLHLRKTSLPPAFLRLNLGGGMEIFPSLQFVFLDWVILDGADWSPLATFLDHRATSGNQLHTLVIASETPRAWKELERAVRVYKHLDTLSQNFFLHSG